MFFAPLAIRRPLPRITPLLPTPMMDLLEPMLMAVTPALSYLTWTGLEPVPAFPLSHQLAELMASWPPLPGHVLDAGRQPVAVVVPSVPLKLNSRSRTIQRAVLSLSQVFSWATEEGTTHAALPPPVVPLPKPSGVPLTPYDCLSPRTAALAVYALTSAKIENFILKYEREDAFLKQRRRLIKYKEWLDSVDGTLPVGHCSLKASLILAQSVPLWNEYSGTHVGIEIPLMLRRVVSAS
jgi:hypothetical protein